MSQTKFHLISPDCVDFLPLKAIELLEISTKCTPAPLFGPSDILMRVRAGIGYLFIVERKQEIVGIFYITFVKAQYGFTMNIVEFSAENLKEWRMDAKEFLLGLLKESGAQNILAVTRGGIGKLFPEFKKIGSLFEYRIEH